MRRGHSSDLQPHVAIGYLQLRDGFCYGGEGTPKQIPPPPPANVGLIFQLFWGRSLAESEWKGRS